VRLGFNVPPNTVQVISGTAFTGNALTHNNRTKSLTYMVKPDKKHKTQK